MMFNKGATFALSCIMLGFIAGCSNQHLRDGQFIVDTKEVKVPIYKQIQVPFRPYPELLTEVLTPASTRNEVLQAYYIDHQTLLNEMDYFRDLLYGKDKDLTIQDVAEEKPAVDNFKEKKLSTKQVEGTQETVEKINKEATQDADMHKSLLDVERTARAQAPHIKLKSDEVKENKSEKSKK